MKKYTGKKLFMTAALVFLLLIVGALVVAGIWADGLLDRINRVNEAPTLSAEEIQSILEETYGDDGTSSDVVMNPEDVILPEYAAEIIEGDDNILNILLIGQDRREHQKRQRSDSMVLCTVNLEKKTMILTSLMRDMYLKIPDWNGQSYDDNRINICYAIGGMEMLNECIEMNFGIVVDYNIEVDFWGFVSIVDTLGGLDIEMTAEEAKAVLGRRSAGTYHLNGEQTLFYSQIRYIDSEYNRTQRQRNVITTMFEKIRGLSMAELKDLAVSFLPLVTTDMKNADIIRCIVAVMPILPELEVSNQRIPAAETCHSAMVGDKCVLIMDLEENRRIVKETLG